jgi:restriction system protein
VLTATGRGRFRITERPQQVLAAPRDRIDISYLMQYPECRTFREKPGKKTPSKTSVAETQSADEAETPEEAIASSYAAFCASVEQELLERVKAASPTLFERLTVELLVAMGYGGSQEDGGKAVGQSGDGGIDGVIKEDRLGLHTIYLQAKRWDGTVGRPVVQAFAGALAGQHARRGVLIASSTFSSPAQAYVKGIEQRILLIDGRELAGYLFDFGVGGVPVGQPHVLKRVDLAFFEEA